MLCYREWVDGESIVWVVFKLVPDITEVSGVSVSGVNIDDKRTGFAVLKYTHRVGRLQQSDIALRMSTYIQGTYK